MNRLNRQTAVMQRSRYFLILTAFLAIAALVAILVWYPNQRNELLGPDQLLLSGSTHDALTAYRRAAASHPTEAALLVRIGLIHTLRGEPAAAQIALASALADSATGDTYDLVRLTQGALAARHSGYGDPDQFWGLLNPQSSLAAQRDTLAADRLVQQGRYAEAEATYRSALLAHPSTACAAHTHTALALLRASSDTQTAREELHLTFTPATNTDPTTVQLLADLLLPKHTNLPDKLTAILDAEAQSRPQLLGQLYLELGFYPLAESQFAQVPADGQLGLAAATYMAYGHWLSGDHAEGLAQLQRIVEQHPEESRARALLALAALSSADPAAAREQLAIIQKTAPNEPSTHLAWGQWYAAQRDYVAAANAYRQALDRAPLGERETYALYLARFFLDSTLDVCSAGLQAAEIAADNTNPSSAALSALAQARLACNDPQGSRTAAERALQRDSTDPEAHYRLGQALAHLGERNAAQQALIAAADNDLGGHWQQRAEDQMAILGLN